MSETTSMVQLPKKYIQTILSERDKLISKNLELETEIAKLRNIVQSGKRTERVEVPETANARKQKFEIGGTSGYIITGEYDDGNLGEVFLILGKEGDAIKGLGDAFAKSISIGIQYGVPLKELVKTFRDMDFFPSGAVSGVPEIKGAKSIPDLISRYLDALYIRKSIQKKEAKTEATMKEVEEAASGNGHGLTECPACKQKTLKRKGAGCNDICLSCNYIESSGGCGG